MRIALNVLPAPATVDRERAAAVHAGVRVEQLTIAWMIVEAVIAIGAGVLARSLLLTAFGIDSVIELVSGGVLLWRLAVEAGGGALERVERAEHRAAWVVGVLLALLCAYVAVSAIAGWLTRAKPEGSLVGIALAVAALVVMPLLVRSKRQIAARIGSAALRGDAACSITCAYMAAALLVGLALNTLLHWWWADSLAALAFLYWLVPETREALANARAGRGGCSCCTGFD